MSKNLAISHVGIRELKNDASAIVKWVRNGNAVTITDRKKSVAMLIPFSKNASENVLSTLIRSGRLSWNGKKPRGLSKPLKIRGATISDVVIEDRR